MQNFFINLIKMKIKKNRDCPLHNMNTEKYYRIKYYWIIVVYLTNTTKKK